MTKAGTDLIAHMDFGKVIEYDKDWKEISWCDAPGLARGARSKDGNTLIGGNQNAFAREIDKDGKVVLGWRTATRQHPVLRRARGDSIGQRQHRTHQLVPAAGTERMNGPRPSTHRGDAGQEVVWVLREWTDRPRALPPASRCSTSPAEMKNRTRCDRR